MKVFAYRPASLVEAVILIYPRIRPVGCRDLLCVWIDLAECRRTEAARSLQP
jgi:hypothetical protein